jgi:hypothetical protein
MIPQPTRLQYAVSKLMLGVRFIYILITDALLVKGSFQQFAMNLERMLFMSRNLQLCQAPCVVKRLG